MLELNEILDLFRKVLVRHHVKHLVENLNRAEALMGQSKRQPRLLAEATAIRDLCRCQLAELVPQPQDIRFNGGTMPRKKNQPADPAESAIAAKVLEKCLANTQRVIDDARRVLLGRVRDLRGKTTEPALQKELAHLETMIEAMLQ